MAAAVLPENTSAVKAPTASPPMKSTVEQFNDGAGFYIYPRPALVV